MVRNAVRGLAALAIVLTIAVPVVVAAPMPAASADVGAPSWWSGDCDANHWNTVAASLGWTGAGAHRLGASYLGVPVCGPRRSVDGAPDVQWSRPGWGHFEWECTELAFRFMAQVYGVTAYGANGGTVVRNYSTSYGGNLETVSNGTLGRAPQPGDIISFDDTTPSTSTRPGHVAVVTASSVDASGTGTVTLMTQNDTTDGWRTIPINAWKVGGFGNYVPYGWLHDPAGRGGSGAQPPANVPLGDGPGAASPATGLGDVFVRGQDDALWVQRANGGAWSGWTGLGGIITAAPAAVSSAPGVEDVFVRGTDKAVWARHFENGTWSGWVGLGGIIVDAPAVASAAPGTVDLFAMGQDNELWTRHFASGTWSGWVGLGGALTSKPAAVSAGPGTIDVFVRGTDGALWSRRGMQGAWNSAWSSVGGQQVTSAPGVASVQPGVIDLLARGGDNALWYRRSTNGTWGPWTSLGGVVTSSAAPSVASTGGLDVFVRGQDDALWGRHLDDGTWTSWWTLGGVVK